MMQLKVLPTDLRELVEQHLGKPLASSANASLWRCPTCPPKSHSLLMVSVDQFRCLGRYPCDGGASEWMRSRDETPAESMAVGEIA